MRSRLFEEMCGAGLRDLLRLADAETLPDVHGIGAVAERFHSPLQELLLSFDLLQIERVTRRQKPQKRRPKLGEIVLDQEVAVPEQIAVLGAHRAPDQSAVARVELLHPARR